MSPRYSVVSQDSEKLHHVLDTLAPELLFASDAVRYGGAIAVAVPTEIDVAHGEGAITKFLFTSGPTKLPKAVINTHRMWCAKRPQRRQSIPALADEPPVLVDWLPWNHPFGGNHNVGIVLFNGGTLSIDDGKPTPSGMTETLRNLREIAPTMHFNLPRGFEAIANAMETDSVLRKNRLSRVKMFFYADAALSQPIRDSLHRTQEADVDERIVMGTGPGTTGSSPFALRALRHQSAGVVRRPGPAGARNRPEAHRSR